MVTSHIIETPNRLPDYGVAVVQDLLYNNAHFFPGVDRAVWIQALQDLRGLTTYDTLRARAF